MKPCRDCGAATAASARACPGCGILNPVMTWVAFPDGSHLTMREAASGGGAAVLAPGVRVQLPPPPKPVSAGGPTGFGDDRLGRWAVFAVVFKLVSFLLVGGAVGGVIAGMIAYPIGNALPTRADGRKIPVPVSWALIVLSFALMAGRIWLVRQAEQG
jgi:hypothetical protein